MPKYQAPTKEQVREYLKRRFGSSGPVPSISEIRSELGWVKRSAPADMPASPNMLASKREDTNA